jgi:hypothetical protein
MGYKNFNFCNQWYTHLAPLNDAVVGECKLSRLLFGVDRVLSCY